MSFTEAVLDIHCGPDRLPGVLALPAKPCGDIAVLIVVGGPQYRAGSHRQFVQSARAWAAAGWPVLRFDVRAMGDADGEPRSFEALDDDIAAAIEGLLQRLPEVRRVVLFGLCDGASAALMYIARRGDSRVAGLCLLNPWLRSEQSLARTHVRHYYGRRLLQREFWAKLFSGRLALSSLTGLLQNLRASRRTDDNAASSGDFRSLMAAGWKRFSGRILLVMSEADLTAREFDEGARSEPVWAGALAGPKVARVDIAAADHTLSDSACLQQLNESTVRWLRAQLA